jgi:adenosylhomocysteine nucleosidase
MFGYEEGQVPGYPAVFKSHLTLVNQIKHLFPHVKKGYLLTGDTFMTDIRPGNYVYDMEGAALYQVAHNYHIPIVSIKVISDVIGMENHIESYTSFEEKIGSQKINEVYQMIFGGIK